MTEIAHFLAHALALETQAGDRYGELARDMECDGDPEISALFARMGEFSRLHAAEIDALARPHAPLPSLAPWQFDWTTPEPPEVGDRALARPGMGIERALAFAIANERRGWEYYNTVAVTAACAETRGLARNFADEEAEHVMILERWLANFQETTGNT